MDIEDLGAQTDEAICKLHDEAVKCGELRYRDPATGYLVFTSESLRSRGRCCGCGCRHCPYNHENVSMKKRAANISAPAMLHGSLPTSSPVDLLFWSGGKDSFLAARALRREHIASGEGSLVLITTFDAKARQVAHQEVDIKNIVRQAQALDLPLLGVPLWPHVRYEVRVREALELLARQGVPVRRVCCGDLWLEHVWQWRVDALAPAVAEVLPGATLHAPLWKVPYEQLLADLASSKVPCIVCAVTGEHGVRMGDTFDGGLVESLSADCDGFGENGEFHTLAKVWDVDQALP